LTGSISTLPDIIDDDPGSRSAANATAYIREHTVPNEDPNPALAMVVSPRHRGLLRANALANILEWQTNVSNAVANNNLDNNTNAVNVPQDENTGLISRLPLQDITNTHDVAVPEWKIILAQQAATRINRRIEEIIAAVDANEEGHFPIPLGDMDENMADMDTGEIKTEDDEGDLYSDTSDGMEEDMDDGWSATSSELMEELGDVVSYRDNYYFQQAYAYYEDGTPIIDPENDEHIVVYVSRRIPQLPERGRQLGPEGTVLHVEYEAPDRSQVADMDPYPSNWVSAPDGRGGYYRRSTTETS